MDTPQPRYERPAVNPGSTQEFAEFLGTVALPNPIKQSVDPTIAAITRVPDEAVHARIAAAIDAHPPVRQ